ncbi:rod shape-determining protein RodA [Candidatus Saccharibacteria bacterium]|nr:rod shape-determining protein RodA [Candidatus Saccharibacteria bacterium]
MKPKSVWQIGNFDNLLLAASTLLVVLGLIVLYSLGIKAKQVSNQLDSTRQIVYALIGFLLLVLAARNDYRVLRNYSGVLYFFMIATLLAVELFGATRLGATRWIALGPFQFQPSELAKLILIIVLAKFYSQNFDFTDQLRFLVKSLVYTLPVIFLVLAQPDLGTAIALGFIWLAMTLSTKVKKKYILGLLLLLLVMMPILYPTLQSYQKERINTFLQPSTDPSGAGYNVNQAIIAVGSGGLYGQGLGSGSQSQGNFLPSSHTDFVFAVLAEKLGFLGALVCILLFVAVIARTIVDATFSSDRFGSLLCIGIATMFVVHVFVNIGMNLGIMPVTGIPLPFISAGGTSLMVSLFAVGLVESVYFRRRGRELRDSELV